MIIFDREYPNGSFYTLDDLFFPNKLWSLCLNFDIVLNGLDLNDVFGSEPLPRTYQTIVQVICDWKASRDSIAVLHPSEEELLLYNKALKISKDKNDMNKMESHHKSGGQQVKDREMSNNDKVVAVRFS